MKILFLRVGEIPETDSRLLKEASFLVSEGHQVTTFGWVESPQRRVTTKNIDYDGQTIESQTVGIKQSYKHKYFKIWAFIKFEFFLFFWLLRHASKFDAIHACNVHTGFVTRLISKFRKFYFVYDIFDYAPDTRHYPKAYRKMVVAMESSTIEHADHVILCSDERIKQIGNVHPKQLSIIYNSPIGSASHKQTSISTNSKLKIVYVGGLTPYRCLPELLQAVQDSPEFELTVAGDGQYKKRFADAAQANNRIHYLGVIPYEKVNDIESESDIMVALYDPQLANHVYASPNKFFEALKLGKPLVMIQGSGMSEWLLEKHFGEIVDPTTESIKEGLQRIADRKDSWADEHLKMTNLYDHQFAWSIMQKKLREIYKR